MADWREYKGVVKKNYIEAAKLTNIYLNLMGFSESEGKKFISNFVKSIEVDGVYDAVEIRNKITELCTKYDENESLEGFDYKFHRIGTKKVSPIESKVNNSSALLFSPEEVMSFGKHMGQNYSFFVEDIPNTPYTRSMFENKTVIQKMGLLKFLIENYSPLDREIIFNVSGLNEDFRPNRIRWTPDNVNKTLESLNGYAKDNGGRIKSFPNLSKLSRSIYTQLHNDSVYGPKLKRALRGDL